MELIRTSYFERKTKIVFSFLALIFCLSGITDEANFQKALSLYRNKQYKESMQLFAKEATENENAEAYFYIGTMFMGCSEIPADMEKAKIFLKISADKGNVSAQYNLGTLYLKEKNILESVRYYEKAAKNGNTDALYNTGLIFAKGDGCEKDLPLALDFFRSAADMKNEAALYMLGTIYEKPGDYAVKADMKLAVEQYQKAADLGSVNALLRLGIIFSSDEDREEGMKKTFECFKRAAELNPDNIEILEAFGDLCSKFERFEEAKAEWNKALLKAKDEDTKKRILQKIDQKKY